jgi:calcyclin binding protein
VTAWNGRNFKFAMSNLNKDIDAEKSYAKATSSGLTIYLKKVSKNDHWDTLEKKKGVMGEKDPSMKPPKMGGKADDGGVDPSANLMEMMKEMYNSGDDNMKRIIAESFAKSQDKGGLNKDL